MEIRTRQLKCCEQKSTTKMGFTFSNLSVDNGHKQRHLVRGLNPVQFKFAMRSKHCC